MGKKGGWAFCSVWYNFESGTGVNFPAEISSTLGGGSVLLSQLYVSMCSKAVYIKMCSIRKGRTLEMEEPLYCIWPVFAFPGVLTPPTG